jgi:hypothetical protein
MHNDVTSLERAFQLAKSGKCQTVNDIKRQMRLEGYEQDQVMGRQLVGQLTVLIGTAQYKDLPRKQQKQLSAGSSARVRKWRRVSH